MDSICNDVLIKIFRYLTIKQIGKLSPVNRTFNELIRMTVWDHDILVIKNAKEIAQLTKNYKIANICIKDKLITDDQFLSMDITNLKSLSLHYTDQLTNACLKNIPSINSLLLNCCGTICFVVSLYKY